MSAFFLDSNIIVKYYITEPGSNWVRSLIADQNNTCLISEITIVEVAAAFSQMRRAKLFGRTQMRNSFDRLQRDIRRGLFFAHPVNVDTLELATEIALTHAIKGYDAVQVASAALAEEWIGTEVIFVSGDKQALRAAQLEALETDNPFTHLDKPESQQ